MTVKITRFTLVAVLGALGVGAVAGAAVTTIGRSSSAQSIANHDSSFPVNANGQTYGSDANTTWKSQPDLIAAFATNGKTGYISRIALEAVDGSDVNSLSQASAYMANTKTSSTIPVYEQDGTTVIGSFVIPAP
jgi:hypothetical protein